MAGQERSVGREPSLSIAAAHSLAGLAGPAQPVAYSATRPSRNNRGRAGHRPKFGGCGVLVAFAISAALHRWIFRCDLHSQPNSSLGITDSGIYRETRRRFSWRSEAPSNLGDSVHLALPPRPLLGVGAVCDLRPCDSRATAGWVALVHGGILRVCRCRRFTRAQRIAQAPLTTESAI